MKTDASGPSAVRPAQSSTGDDQDRMAGAISQTPKSASNTRIVHALAYRYWCLFRHKFILMCVFNAIPLLILLLIVAIKWDSMPHDESKHVNVTKPQSLLPHDILTSCSAMYPIGVSPDNESIKNLMTLVSEVFRSNGVDFGPVVFKSDAQELSHYMARVNDKSQKVECGFGINFLETPTSLTYTLRSVKTQEWNTNKLFPDIMNPGPMNNGEMYLKTGFLALQYAINTVYATVMGLSAFIMTAPFPGAEMIPMNLLLQHILQVRDNNTQPPQIMVNSTNFQNFTGPSNASMIEDLMTKLRSSFKPFTYSIQAFPYPAYSHIDEESYKNHVLLCSVFYYYSIFLVVIMFGIWMVQEKVNGMKELLKANGLKSWMLHAGWFIMFGLVSLPISVIITACWKIPLRGEALTPNSNPLLEFTILMVYSCSNFACVGFLCSLVSSQTYTAIVIVVYYVLTSWFEIVPVKNIVGLSFLTLIPNCGMFEIINALIHFEEIGAGAYYTNLLDDPQITDKVALPIGISLLIMIIGMFLFTILMAYIDAIKPGPFGRAKPWYFIFNYFRSNSRTVHPISDTSLKSSSNAVIETIGANKPVGLKIVDLVKTFGYVKAVDGLNLRIYKNEITALLGHNGAGKTTLFSIICGMYSPTSGHVYTEGYSIFSENNLSQFRKDLGYCPQHNLLFSDMNVQEHLVFFGIVKGFTHQAALARSNYWTRKFKMHDRRDKTVSHLSGGMKRKLCLAIALVGDPLYLLLDEPTSGLDPESRRNIWNLLLSVRGNRTVLISTHDMEEADILGDWIAIIANGSLRCFGTGAFLKRHYGYGYQLKISSRKGSGSSIIKLIQGFVPSARLLNSTGNVIVVSLPSRDVANFPALFADLDRRYSQSDYSLSSTNMGDVFIKVQESEGVTTSITADDMPFLSEDDSSDEDSKSSGTFGQQFLGLIGKQCNRLRRQWISIVFFIMFMPTVSAFFVSAMLNGLYSTVITSRSGSKNLRLDLAIYKDSIGFIENRGNDSLFRAFESLVTESGSQYEKIGSNASVVQVLLDSANADLAKYRTNTIFALESGNIPGPNVLYSTLAYHSAPILSGMLANAYLRTLNVTAHISTFNFPYDFQGNPNDDCEQSKVFSSIFLASALIFIGGGSIIPYLVVFPHIERVTRFKHLQIMTGVRPFLYWVLNFIVDGIIILLGISLMLLIILLVDRHKLFSRYGALNAMASALYLHAFGMITTCYLASYLFKTHSVAMSFIACFCVAAILVLFAVAVGRVLKWLKYGLYLVPIVPLISSISKIFYFTSFGIDCESCPPVSIEYCEDFVDSAEAFFEITEELIYLGVDPVVFLVIILLIEHGLFFCRFKTTDQLEDDEIETGKGKIDANVVSEKQAVEEALRNRNQEDSSLSEPTFVCDGLAKQYSSSIVAVRDVSFVIPNSECFGLLGTNGAGKSTTFEMLTGILRPSKGNAYVFYYCLTSDRRDYLKRLGYCPQQDGLFPALSAREHLTLFGRLRGVPSDDLPELVQKWIDVVDMTPICDRPCKTYSGGNKRKLSTAIALIGDPPIVLLDEPTTGVDPVIRRKIWSILKHCQETNGQTIILTSHSMDECEATCERLTIMVNGRMECIGTIPYLKNAYGRAFVVMIKLTAECTSEESKRVEQRIEKTFAPHVRILDQQQNLLSFSIDSVVTLQKVFQAMISMKASLTQMEDFSVANISLEQVFLSFAKAK